MNRLFSSRTMDIVIMPLTYEGSGPDIWLLAKLLHGKALPPPLSHCFHGTFTKPRLLSPALP